MGPHITWFNFLPGYRTLYDNLQHYLGREWTWQMFQATHFQLDHIFGGILVLLFLAYGAFRYAAKVNRAADGGLVPPPRFGMRNLFEMLSDTIYNLMVSVMGEKEARRYLPLIGALLMFILFSNLHRPDPGLHRADRHAQDQPRRSRSWCSC